MKWKLNIYFSRRLSKFLSRTAILNTKVHDINIILLCQRELGSKEHDFTWSSLAIVLGFWEVIAKPRGAVPNRSVSACLATLGQPDSKDVT